MCSLSTDETGRHTWCGIGWTGQPNVIPRRAGDVELRFGAYDRGYHFLDAATGTPLRPTLMTGDLAKGSATSDPDGYPLYYAGSRDNKLRVVALDRARPKVLWQVDADTSVPEVVWNNDWDGAPLVVGDYLLEGGENSWFYVIKLNRGYDRDGKVRCARRSCCACRAGTTAAASTTTTGRSRSRTPSRSTGVSPTSRTRPGSCRAGTSRGVLKGGRQRDASFVSGPATTPTPPSSSTPGFLYVAASSSSSTALPAPRPADEARSSPARQPARLVGAAPGRGRGARAARGRLPLSIAAWCTSRRTPAGCSASTAVSGTVRWTVRLPGPTWGSPVVVDGVLIEGDCRAPCTRSTCLDHGRQPRELWTIRLGGCIESTPAVWKGRIYVGTRGGAMYALGC